MARQSTIVARHGKKRRKKSPVNFRCGIVETCRNAVIKPDGGENTYCEGSVVKVKKIMADVKLVNVKKIYPISAADRKRQAKKKKVQKRSITFRLPTRELSQYRNLTWKLQTESLSFWLDRPDAENQLHCV